MKVDRRKFMIALILSVAVLGGAAIQLLPDRLREVSAGPVAGPDTGPEQGVPAHAGELHERFQQAVAMLHVGEYRYALAALERVLDLAPDLPEARVNLGFTLLGLGNARRAREEFMLAIELRPGQANAYYGLAMALEQMGDQDGALGAMRAFVHLAGEGGSYRRRALAAIWEWEAERGRLRGRASSASAPPG